MNNNEKVTIPKDEYERLLSLEKRHNKPKKPQPKLCRIRDDNE